MFVAACSEAGATSDTLADGLDVVEWTDDFLGGLDRRYSVLGAIRCCVVPTDRAGGWIRVTPSPEREDNVGYFRLGDENRDVNRPWSHQAFAVGRTRVVFETFDHVHATIGFVGPVDPEGVGGALLYRHDGGASRWFLQTCEAGACNNVPANVVAAAGVPFTVEIRLSPDRAEAFVDGRKVATSTAHVPEGDAFWEFAIWGYPDGAGVPTEPAMLIDYLNITQQRH